MFKTNCWTEGWPRVIDAQQKKRNMRRQGRRWDTMKRVHVKTKRKRKIVEESASFEKFVGGVMILRTPS